MNHSDFKIGDQFICGDNLWQVTDIGTRTIAAIPYRRDWMAGPPYAMPEHVFDENDMPGCKPKP